MDLLTRITIVYIDYIFNKDGQIQPTIETQKEEEEKGIG